MSERWSRLWFFSVHHHWLEMWRNAVASWGKLAWVPQSSMQVNPVTEKPSLMCLWVQCLPFSIAPNGPCLFFFLDNCGVYPSKLRGKKFLRCFFLNAIVRKANILTQHTPGYMHLAEVIQWNPGTFCSCQMNPPTSSRALTYSSLLEESQIPKNNSVCAWAPFLTQGEPYLSTWAMKVYLWKVVSINMGSC